ncbi:MAG: hypothetical protein ACE37J_14070 [Pikeienuella sp.]|uniref:hypothetical protein n=1 Tax=Pikeienuella sp. TaxID=2831957 RepID=UPI00391CFBAF
MKLIKPHEIRFTASITEEELRARLVAETLENIGALGPEGKPAVGVTTRITRGESRRGGYTITVTTPMPASLLALTAREGK